MSSPEMAQLVQILLLLAVLSVLAAILPLSRSLSFDTTDFSGIPASGVCPNASKEAIFLMGYAHVEPLGYLQLTSGSGSSGRAYWCQPLHLWDSATGAVTNFTTTFSFDLVDQYPEYYGNRSGGMTFYLSPIGWPFQSLSYGYSLGLGNDTDFPGVVAVEFDSVGDASPLTSGSHIGIDNGNLQSLVIQEIGPLNRFISRAIGKAVVSYDSAATKLSVSLSFNDTLYGISWVLDLTTVLPEWVSVGFSGSTSSDSYDMKRIRSWSFESSLDAIPKHPKKNTTRAADSPAAAVSDPANNTESLKKKKNLWKWVAAVSILIVGFFSLVSALLCYCWQRKQKEGPGGLSQGKRGRDDIPAFYPSNRPPIRGS